MSDEIHSDPSPHSPPGDITRRAALGVLGAAGVAALGGRIDTRLPGATGASPPALASLACVVTPAQTEGPYFVDEKLQRADLRSDPTTGAVSAGVPLRLRLLVHRVDGAVCAPVTGAAVDVWQCDASGIYSDVRDFQGLFDTRGRKFLRGYQVTDGTGAVEFTTIYPGWYAGRAVHIHFKIRLAAGAGRAYEFTSQLYFDEEVTDLVHGRPPYDGKGRRDTVNTADRTFARAGQDGERLMLDLVREGSGYAGALAVGLRMS